MYFDVRVSVRLNDITYLRERGKIDSAEIRKKKKKRNSFILTSDLRSIWHSACSNFVFFVVIFVNIHRALALRLLKVQRKREANGARLLIMRGILKSRQLVENLRLSFELFSYVFHKMTVKRKKSEKILDRRNWRNYSIPFSTYTYMCVYWLWSCYLTTEHIEMKFIIIKVRMDHAERGRKDGTKFETGIYGNRLFRAIMFVKAGQLKSNCQRWKL